MKHQPTTWTFFFFNLHILVPPFSPVGGSLLPFQRGASCHVASYSNPLGKASPGWYPWIHWILHTTFRSSSMGKSSCVNIYTEGARHYKKKRIDKTTCITHSIRCKVEAYKFLARGGCGDLIDAVAGQSERVLPSIASIVRGIKYAISTHDDDTLRAALATLTQLIKAVPEVGKGELELLTYLVSQPNSLNILKSD